MTLYRTLMALALPFLLAAALWRKLSGRGVAAELRERLALTRGGGPVIWLHGASNGEITSARSLIVALARLGPVLVTCNNPTARAMVRGWALPGVSAALAPYDTPGALRRFLARWQPRALISLENELWPERVLAMQAAGRPVLAVAARMSERSAARWQRRAPALMARLMAAHGWLSAQDAASEARFRRLGLPADRLGPRQMLKAAAEVIRLPPPFAAPPRARVLLAASTHEGEEEPILAAHRQGAFDLLILAPRHPQRGPAIEALITAQGLRHATRSKGEVPGHQTQVYLADTLGEMPHWYAMAGATIIGGSLVPKGGHTPFEPAAYGSALIHGPSVANFTEVFAALDAGGGARAVTADTLAEALAGLDAAAQARMVQAARLALPHSADHSALLAALARLTA